MSGSRLLTFKDPYEYQASLGTGGKFVLTQRGAFELQTMQIDLHRLQLRRGKMPLPGIVYSGLKERCGVTFFTTACHPPVTFNGSEASSDHIAYYAPGDQTHSRSHSHCLFQNILIMPEHLTEAAIALAHNDLSARAQSHLSRPPPHLLARIRRIAAAVADVADTVPEVLTSPEAAKAIEQELLRSVVACLGADLAPAERVSRHHRVPIMRRFERVVEENPNAPLYLPEVCAAIGVTDRALRKHCQQYLGMGPAQYLWLRRMNLARRALRRAFPSKTTVTSIATEFGFWELGRFAVGYRQLFGESPSATLRLEPDLLR